MKDKTSKDKEFDVKVNKLMQESLACIHGDKHDDEDIAYVMARTYLANEGVKLIGDKIFSGKKHVADLKEYKFINKELQLKIKYKNPMHYLILNCEVDLNDKG